MENTADTLLCQQIRLPFPLNIKLSFLERDGPRVLLLLVGLGSLFNECFFGEAEIDIDVAEALLLFPGQERWGKG